MAILSEIKEIKDRELFQVIDKLDDEMLDMSDEISMVKSKLSPLEKRMNDLTEAFQAVVDYIASKSEKRGGC